MGENGYFEFKEEIELPEDLDYNNLKPCPHCKKPIPYNATLCLYCGEPIETTTKDKWIKWVIIFIVIAFLLLILHR